MTILNRYHLYVSKACPWCHRVLIVMALKGLQNCISVTNTSPHLRNMSNRGKAGLDPSQEYIGWHFNDKYKDTLFPNAKSVWDIYKMHNPNYSNKDALTVPILFDKHTKTIVNNESAELIEILNSEFNKYLHSLVKKRVDLNHNNQISFNKEIEYRNLTKYLMN